MGGPSAVACSYRSPHDPSSPTTNCSNRRSTESDHRKQPAPLRRPDLKTHLQSFIKPAVATVGERPAPMQHLSCLPAGVPVNQEFEQNTTSHSVPSGSKQDYLRSICAVTISEFHNFVVTAVQIREVPIVGCCQMSTHKTIISALG